METPKTKDYKTAIKQLIEELDVLKLSNIIASRYKHKTMEFADVLFNPENEIWIKEAKEHIYRKIGNEEIFIDNLEIGTQTTVEERYFQIVVIAFLLCIKEKVREGIREINIESLDDFKNQRFPRSSFYRGQANYEWRLTPSIIRELNKDIVLDDNAFYKMSCSSGIEKKYNNLIRNAGFEAYRRYAFIQHALSFTPLIDLTRDQIIATSFALYNPSSINNFTQKDAVVYVFTPKLEDKLDMIRNENDARNFLKTEMKIYALNEPSFCFGRTYLLDKYDSLGNITKEAISFVSIPKIVDLLTPKFRFIDCPTNDRMLYQKGLFLVFHDCVALKSNILFELNSEFRFAKVIIKTKDKRSILSTIYKDYRQYDYEHLMNPYLYFNE